MNYIDILIVISNYWMTVKMLFSYMVTIKFDPFHISNRMINFRNSKEYQGYKISESDTEYNRRIVHWFYRTVDAPCINDWDICIKLFGLEKVPPHVLQLCDKCGTVLEKYIIVRSISKDGINYSFKNDEVEDKCLKLPLGFASLVPERFIFNLNLFNNMKIC